MPFYISAERAVKLVDRFKSLEADRAIVRSRMEQYRPCLPRVSVAPAAVEGAAPAPGPPGGGETGPKARARPGSRGRGLGRPSF